MNVISIHSFVFHVAKNPHTEAIGFQQTLWSDRYIDNFVVFVLFLINIIGQIYWFSLNYILPPMPVGLY